MLKIVPVYYLNSNRNIIAPNLKADNESRLAALENQIDGSVDNSWVSNDTITNKDAHSGITFTVNNISTRTIKYDKSKLDAWSGTVNAYFTATDLNGNRLFIYIYKENSGYGYFDTNNTTQFVKASENTIQFNFPQQGYSYSFTLAIRRVAEEQQAITYTYNITYKNEPAYKETYTNKLAYLKDIIDVIYPVGSIYTSMNSTSPAILFGGTWTQITDRFLYCSNTDSNVTGGSKTITIDNLPSHTHNSVVSNDRIGNPDGSADISPSGSSNGQQYWRGNRDLNLASGSAQTSSTGSGTDYMPPYITVYAWYRTE